MSPVTPVLLLQQPMKIHPSILAEAHHNSAPEEVDAPLVDAKYQLAWQQPMGSSILFTEKKMELPAGVQTGRLGVLRTESTYIRWDVVAASAAARQRIAWGS